MKKQTTKKKWSLKSPSLRVWLIIWAATAILGYLCGEWLFLPEQHERLTSERLDSLEFRDELKTMIFELRIEHPEIVYAQAVLESAGFTSAIWKENNNMFGMKPAWNRITTCIGANRSYAVYLNWRYSVLDYALWQSMNARGLDEDEYFGRLGAVYAEDPKYVMKLKEIIRKNK